MSKMSKMRKMRTEVLHAWQGQDAGLVTNFALAGAISFISNIACHLVLVRVFGVYTDPCNGIVGHRPANNLVGYSLITIFQLPALGFWLARERSRMAVPIALVSNAAIALIWWWWTDVTC